MNGSHVAAILGVLALLGAFSWYVLWRHGRNERKRAAQCEPWQHGDHEACEVSDEEERIWKRDFKDRYPSLGKQVER